MRQIAAWYHQLRHWGHLNFGPLAQNSTFGTIGPKFDIWAIGPEFAGVISML
jgi:hypothetical protein